MGTEQSRNHLSFIQEMAFDKSHLKPSKPPRGDATKLVLDFSDFPPFLFIFKLFTENRQTKLIVFYQKGQRHRDPASDNKACFGIFPGF